MQAPGGPHDAQPAIADYGFLSDCHSAALVDRSGSVDWWCVPCFDSPSVLGRLLDPAAGHWFLRPTGGFSSERRYLGDTLVLQSTHRTGTVSVTDALLLEPGARGHEVGRRSPHLLLRRVEGLAGTVAMRTDLSPRMEYGRTEPHLRQVPGGAEATGGPVTLTLRLEDGSVVGEFDVASGDVVDLLLSYAPTFGHPPDRSGRASLEETLHAWTSWTAQHTGNDGGYFDQVRRSSLVLQGLTYGPSGAVLAAATTALPETMGGELNFDYRYAWLRDLSLTIRSLWLAAYPTSPPGCWAGWPTAPVTSGTSWSRSCTGSRGSVT